MSFLGAIKALFIDIPLTILFEVVYFVFRCRPQKQIKGQNVLVTGGADGIGAEFALRFANLGNTVHIVDYNEKLCEKRVEELQGKGFNVKGYTCDMTKWEDIEALYQRLKKDGVFISYIVNNAGMTFAKDITEYSHSQIEYEIKLNLISYLWITKLFLPEMKLKNTGHIINVASLAAVFPMFNGTVYCASKAGVDHFCEALRFGLINTDIKVTSICPTFVKTKFLSGMQEEMEKKKVFHLITKEHLLDISMTAIKEDKERVIIPRATWINMMLLRILPVHMKNKMSKNAYDASVSIFKNFSQEKEKKIA